MKNAVATAMDVRCSALKPRVFSSKRSFRYSGTLRARVARADVRRDRMVRRQERPTDFGDRMAGRPGMVRSADPVASG